jgi:hypothetical protein
MQVEPAWVADDNGIFPVDPVGWGIVEIHARLFTENHRRATDCNAGDQDTGACSAGAPGTDAIEG